MYIVIAGCGRVGSLLAGQLSREEHDVVIIDHSENAFDSLPGEFSGFKITGDATEFSVLKTAKIETADFLFATCREDTLNLMVAQVAKHIFGVPKVIARVYQVSYEDIFEKLNIDIISPTRLALNACLETLIEAGEPKDSGV